MATALSKAFAKSIIKMSFFWSSSKFDVRSSMNTINCVSQDLPLLNLCCSGYRILFVSPWFMILLARTCYIILQQTLVNDIGQ